MAARPRVRQQAAAARAWAKRKPHPKNAPPLDATPRIARRHTHYLSSALPAAEGVAILKEKLSYVVLGSHGPCTDGFALMTGRLRSRTAAVDEQRRCSSTSTTSCVDLFLTPMSFVVPSTADAASGRARG